ncbi:MAG: acyltransferase family protein [Nocardioides sp.]
MNFTVDSPPRGTLLPARQPHRADIQGLRAIAVLIVIGAHAGLSPLTGGFVGVDVFFVVSGFLISRLLFLEASRTGTISLRSFYARRARRILPAATVVSMVTLLGSLIWLTARQALDVVYDVAWATFFGANFRFGQREVDYFAQDLGPSPIQHYWSLSVEEQFYLIWPLILVGCLGWTRRKHAPENHRGRLPRIALIVALTALTIASFGYATVLTHTSPIAAYFSTAARAWELGVGAIVALIAPSIAQLMSGRPRSLLAATGLGLIAVSCIEFGASTPFPGSAALLPVIGAALVLVAGTYPGPADAPGQRSVVVRSLGWSPLQVVGDWSYSLYLWHWPVLILARQGLGRDLKPVETALALVAIFGLSAATYWWVETPFREGRVPIVDRPAVLYPAVIAVVIVACLGAGGYASWSGSERGNNPAITLADYPEATRQATASDGPEPGPSKPAPAKPTPAKPTPAKPAPLQPVDQATALVKASAIAARQGRAIPSDLTPDLFDLSSSIVSVGACDYSRAFTTLCPRGDPDADRTLVVIGDSHARAWIPAFDIIGAKGKWTTYYLTRPGCTAARVSVSDRSGALDNRCTEFHDWTLTQLRRVKPDLIIVATAPANNGVYLNDKRVTDLDQVATEMAAGYDQLFARLAPLANQTVLIRDVPRASENIAECLGSRGSDLGDCLVTPVPYSTRLADVSVRAARRARVEVVDSTGWFCWQKICPPVIGSTIPMRDSQHMRAAYSRQLAEPLGRALSLWPS